MFLNTIKAILNDNWPILVIFVITLVLVRFFYLRNHHEKVSFYKEFLMILSICYIFLLFQLLTKVEMNSNSGYNIIPFEEIFRYEVGSRLFIYNVFGNIMAFVLFGLIVSCYIKPKTVFPPFVISLLVSITVEFVQLNIGRSFDVDDVILNVIGGLFGYILYRIIDKIFGDLDEGIKGSVTLILLLLVIVVLTIMVI